MKKLLLLPLVVASAALAHPGHGGMLAGVSHPVTGADHLMAMLAVGVLAARRREIASGSLWTLPALFAGSLVAGALLPALGVTLAFAEAAILLSLLAFGALLVLDVSLPKALLLPAVAAFGICHGFAHGAESGGITAQFLAGCAAATLGLHALGAWIALKVGTRPAAVAWGGASALACLVLAFG